MNASCPLLSARLLASLTIVACLSVSGCGADSPPPVERATPPALPIRPVTSVTAPAKRAQDDAPKTDAARSPRTPPTESPLELDQRVRRTLANAELLLQQMRRLESESGAFRPEETDTAGSSP